MKASVFAQAVGADAVTAVLWADPFSAAMALHGIDTPRRQAIVLAQVGHESAGLQHLEEQLHYSAARLREKWPSRFPSATVANYYAGSPERLGNYLYANRMGNGSYESGDGYRFRGRGPLQITGRLNYRTTGEGIALPLLEHPELLTTPSGGALSACWWLVQNGCLRYADEGDVDSVSAIVNTGNAKTPRGSVLGLADRAARYRQALQLLEGEAHG